MGRLSITAAWNETADFLKLHFGALFTIVVAFVALPGIAMQALGPEAAAPGRAPEPGLWMLLLPVVLVLNIVGSLAISSLALGRQSVVGEAIAHGFRRVLPMLGAVLILLVAMTLLLVPLVLLAGIEPGDLASPTPAKTGRIALVIIVLVAIALFVGVRLLLMTPVAAAEPAGPIAIIRRSWDLTEGRFWKLLGFLVLMLIVAIVVMTVVTLILGLLIAAVAGPPEQGSVGALMILMVGGIVNAAFVVVMTTLVARIYLQLSGAGGAGATSGS